MLAFVTLCSFIEYLSVMSHSDAFFMCPLAGFWGFSSGGGGLLPSLYSLSTAGVGKLLSDIQTNIISNQLSH